MIDCESPFFDEVSIGVEAEYPTVYVSPYPARVEDRLACVYIKEVSNYPYSRCADSGNYENVTNVTYEIRVYSNGTNKKKICKDLIKYIDNIVTRLGFKRGMMNPIEFIEDNTLYTMIVRYSGLVKDVDGKYIIYKGG